MPSPCGLNSKCQIANDAPLCTCLSEYIGEPPNCRPECVSNGECSTQLACINQKCRDPCPGSCGINSECRVISHASMCVCIAGFEGDPFVQCNPKQSKCAIVVMSVDYIQYCLQTVKVHSRFPRRRCHESCKTNTLHSVTVRF